MEIIDKEIEKFDKPGDKGVEDMPSVRDGPHSVLVGSKASGPVRFLNSLFVSSDIKPMFMMGSKSGPTRANGPKIVTKPRHLRKSNKKKGAVLAKRGVRDSDEDMEEMEGSRKRGAVCDNDISVEAGVQPRRQQRNF